MITLEMRKKKFYKKKENGEKDKESVMSYYK